MDIQDQENQKNISKFSVTPHTSNNSDNINNNNNKTSINHFHPSIRSRRSNQSAYSNLAASIQFKPYPQKMSLQSDISEKAKRFYHQQDLFDEMACQNNGLTLYDLGLKNRNSFYQLNRMVQQNPRRSDVRQFAHQNDNKFQPPQRISIQNPIQQQQKFSCKCSKSKCLLMYCECFSKGVVCNESCSCYQCRNNVDFQEKRQKARNSVLQKNPNAFNSKFQMVGGKGCNCKKTLCFKKYCQCFYAGVKCTYLCKCQNCMNGGENAYNKQG